MKKYIIESVQNPGMYYCRQNHVYMAFSSMVTRFDSYDLAAQELLFAITLGPFKIVEIWE